MPSAKLVVGGAAATAALGVRVARSLYGRWRVLPEQDRRRIEGLAEDLKHRALELRGASDSERANEGLRAANETLAAALVETAAANPEVGEDEVLQLRSDLKRELERLAGADIKALRTRRETNSSRG
ncbi:MAG TPA: hypothetical protein VES62_01485 [Thermoleophilaceae bacterium]|nr:hypothetical protein [Thermoleophilaceae bacterium]